MPAILHAVHGITPLRQFGHRSTISPLPLHDGHLIFSCADVFIMNKLHAANNIVMNFLVYANNEICYTCRISTEFSHKWPVIFCRLRDFMRRHLGIFCCGQQLLQILQRLNLRSVPLIFQAMMLLLDSVVI